MSYVSSPVVPLPPRMGQIPANECEGYEISLRASTWLTGMGDLTRTNTNATNRTQATSQYTRGNTNQTTTTHRSPTRMDTVDEHIQKRPSSYGRQDTADPRRTRRLADNSTGDGTPKSQSTTVTTASRFANHQNTLWGVAMGVGRTQSNDSTDDLAVDPAHRQFLDSLEERLKSKGRVVVTVLHEGEWLRAKFKKKEANDRFKVKIEGFKESYTKLPHEIKPKGYKPKR